MSRTDIDAATFADYLRQMCGDGSVEWSYEPMQTSVLLDVADMLDENAKLWELVRHMNTCLEHYEPDGSVGCEHCPLNNDAGNCDYERRMHELEVGE